MRRAVTSRGRRPIAKRRDGGAARRAVARSHQRARGGDVAREDAHDERRERRGDERDEVGDNGAASQESDGDEVSPDIVSPSGREGEGEGQSEGQSEGDARERRRVRVRVRKLDHGAALPRVGADGTVMCLPVTRRRACETRAGQGAEAAPRASEYASHVFVRRVGERALFACNLSAADTDAGLLEVFERWGDVAALETGAGAGGRFARVSFRDADAADAVLGTTRATLEAWGGLSLAGEGEDAHVGLRAWVASASASQSRDYDALERAADEAIDALEREERAGRAEGGAGPATSRAGADADGFVLVRRSAKKRGVVVPSVALAQVEALEQRLAKKQRAGVAAGLDLYRFQRRDRREQALGELRAKFERGRSEVERLKAEEAS